MPDLERWQKIKFVKFAFPQYGMEEGCSFPMQILAWMGDFTHL